jgi:hypothetical protein
MRNQQPVQPDLLAMCRMKCIASAMSATRDTDTLYSLHSRPTLVDNRYCILLDVSTGYWLHCALELGLELDLDTGYWIYWLLTTGYLNLCLLAILLLSSRRVASDHQILPVLWGRVLYDRTQGQKNRSPKTQHSSQLLGLTNASYRL